MGVIIRATRIVVDSDIPQPRVMDRSRIPIRVGDQGFSIEADLEEPVQIVARGFRAGDDAFERFIVDRHDCPGDDPCGRGQRSERPFDMRLDSPDARVDVRVGVRLRPVTMRALLVHPDADTAFWAIAEVLGRGLASAEDILDELELLRGMEAEEVGDPPTECGEFLSKFWDDLSWSDWISPPPSADELREKRDEWRDGIRAKWNRAHPVFRFVSELSDVPGFESAETYEVGVDVEWDPPAARRHYTTDVLPAYDRDRYLCFHEQMDSTTAAHEFGHMLGLPDEYRPAEEDDPCPGRIIKGSYSLMARHSGEETPTVQRFHFRYIAEFVSNRLCRLYSVGVPRAVVATGGGGFDADPDEPKPYPLWYTFTDDPDFCPGPLTFRIDRL